MSKSGTFFIFILVAGFVLVTQSAFIVRQGTQAMVLQFGRPASLYTEPGLKFKTPFIQNVRVFQKRVLNVAPPAEEVILADQKRLVIDAFGRYRITDMLAFNNAVGTEDAARDRINNLINSVTREVLGTATLTDVLSDKRAQLMHSIKERVNAAAKNLGVEIVDVRIGRADLPEQTSQSIFDRMKTARQQEAAQFRAEGKQFAQETRAQADKERTVLLAEAGRQAQIQRGLGDEEAIKIYADAFKQDPEFYGFYRSMEAYRESLSGSDTTLILSPDSDFFKYFKESAGAKSPK